MDADRFDSLAKRLVTPTTRRATLGSAAAGGLLSALGLGRAQPETHAAQGGTCVLQFAAQVRQGPSAGRALVPNGARAGELRGELSFGLEQSGRLQNGLLQLSGGQSFPVVGQAMGHSLQLRIELAPRLALVAVGVGEQQISRCQGAIDGMTSGPDLGDLGDWHAAAVQQARGGASGGDSGGTEGGRGRGRTTARDADACPEGEVFCDIEGGYCAHLATNISNCGRCGNRCAGDREICRDGACVARDEATNSECGPRLTRCGSECVDLRTSAVNCGDCGNACVPGAELCLDGVCRTEVAVTCGPGQVQCGTICCAVGETCIIGECACVQGRTTCGDTCVDLQTDPDNCGECGLPCASELGAGTCIAGECSCSPGTTRCDDICVNTNRDPLNCGECGNACTDGGDCFDGTCAPGETACPQGQTRCSNACVDTTSDAGNCSACGRACGADERCSGSLCVPISGGGGCRTGLTPCGPTCADVQTDPDNCGRCGNACAAGETCVGGECAPGATGGGACPEGQVRCGGTCQDALPNFGSDGLSCPGGGAPPSECPAGRVLCNGACFPEGACQPVECPPGWGYCYGLCRDFQNDPGYCGGCTTGCTGGAYCAAGECVSCPEGQTPCGQACVNTNTDLNHCGGCGNRCGTQCLDGQCTGVGPSPIVCARVGESCADRPCCGGNVCAKGTCYVPTEGNGSCGPLTGDPIRCAIPGPIFFCVDVDNDPNFCGDCGTVCAAGDLCRDGNCFTPNLALPEQQPLAPTDEEPQPEPEPAEPELADTEPEPSDPQALPPADVAVCPEEQVACGGVCTDVSFDPLNCGECGFVCGSGSACNGGVCGADPAPPTAPEEPVVAAEEPAECLAAGGACDPATPGVCCSGVCNDDSTCA